jgi:hypothetical protein
MVEYFFDIINLHTLCLDIDECLSSACGPHANISCINVQGSYKCVCDKGFIVDEDNNSCIGM